MGFKLSLLTIALSLSLVLGLALKHHQRYEEGIDAVVDLGYSKYKGKSFSDGTSHWLGVRYAAAPLGPLRFAEPQKPPHNDTVQLATTHGDRCLATHNEPSDKPIPDTRNEDCLFADIYAPSDAKPDSRWPVYIFIQGGGFNDNSGNEDGKTLVKASGLNIVVVTFNYRVGPYGFLASTEVQNDGSLNNGLKDQRMLLGWVQEHIQQFGGDPEHVVIGGASAGAASVTLQLVAYGGRDDGLFHGTAAESQSFAALRTVSESQYQYDELVNRTGCLPQHTGKNDTLSCLRGLDMKELDKANYRTKFPGAKILPLFAYNPTLDYDFIQDYTYNLFKTGRFVRVPGIYGDDTNEATVFVPRLLKSAQESKDWIQAQFPTITDDQFDSLLNLYPPVKEVGSKSTSYWASTCAAYADLRYICGGFHLNEQYAHAGVKANYNYRYNVEDAKAMSVGLGVPHVAEFTAIWGEGEPKSYQEKGANADVVPLMQGYWLSFIRTLDPNSKRLAGSPVWEAWTANGDGAGQMRRLLVQGGNDTTAMETVDPAEASRCDVLGTMGPSLRQ